METGNKEKVDRPDLPTVTTDLEGQQQNALAGKRVRKRLACKGSFKSQPAKFFKEGGQPLPGILDFPPNISLSHNLMHGTFCPDAKLVRLSNFSGKMTSHMGFVRPGCQGAMFLHPEEAIFLVEAGRLVVHHRDTNDDEQTNLGVNSVQEAYHLMLSSDVPLSYYIVYARLARTGFKVLISAAKNGKQRVYDAHTPTTDFAKTHPPPPAFRVIGIYRWDEPFPSVSQLFTLQSQIDEQTSDVALKIAVVAPDGDVSFYSVNFPLPKTSSSS